MILEDLDAMSKKIAKIGVLSPNFFSRDVSKFRGCIFDCRRTFVVWQSFVNVGAEMGEKACLEKHDVKYNGRSSVAHNEANISCSLVHIKVPCKQNKIVIWLLFYVFYRNVDLAKNGKDKLDG